MNKILYILKTNKSFNETTLNRNEDCEKKLSLEIVTLTQNNEYISHRCIYITDLNQINDKVYNINNFEVNFNELVKEIENNTHTNVYFPKGEYIINNTELNYIKSVYSFSIEDVLTYLKEYKTPFYVGLIGEVNYNNLMDFFHKRFFV